MFSWYLFYFCFLIPLLLAVYCIRQWPANHGNTANMILSEQLKHAHTVEEEEYFFVFFRIIVNFDFRKEDIILNICFLAFGNDIVDLFPQLITALFLLTVHVTTALN